MGAYSNDKVTTHNKTVNGKIYSSGFETLWNDLRQLYDKRTELDPNFSFNKMAFEINNLLNKRKAIER